MGSVTCPEGYRETFGNDGSVYQGTVVMGTQVDAYIQTQQIVHMNYVQFLAYLLQTSKRLEE